MREGTPWYEAFFDAEYLRLYEHQFTEERAEKEVSFVLEALGLAAGASLLDLCCGQGRHAVVFAGRGLEVTAQDLSREYVALAEEAAAAAGVELRSVVGDMREIPFENEFDAVVNMFTSFGYLESEAEESEGARGDGAGAEAGRPPAAGHDQPGMGGR